MKEKNVRVSLTLPQWLFDLLSVEAVNASCTVSHFIRVLLLKRAFSSVDGVGSDET